MGQATTTPGETSGPDLAGLEAEPFRLLRPREQTAPFVFASPHSGRLYPASFVAASRLSQEGLRQSEDAFVDELFEAVAALGAPLIAARFPRAYVDVNRGAGELDEAMFDGALTVAADAPSARVSAGLGVIPKVVREGAQIYRGKLDPGEAARRLSRLYMPYHTALAGLIEETCIRFGCAVMIDCHSMPSASASTAAVFGDCYGTSINHGLLRHIERAFAASGFSTARNAPYAGGFTTHLWARRDGGIHALQIEINRALYLDEDRIEKTGAFADLRQRIIAALRLILSYDAELLRPVRPLAAE